MEIAVLVTAPGASRRVPTSGSREQTAPSQTSLHWALRPVALPLPGAPELLRGAPWSGHLLRPAFSRGHGEEGQQSPQHVVIMELVLPPLSVPCLHLVLLIEEVLATATENGDR